MERHAQCILGVRVKLAGGGKGACRRVGVAVRELEETEPLVDPATPILSTVLDQFRLGHVGRLAAPLVHDGGERAHFPRAREYRLEIHLGIDHSEIRRHGEFLRDLEGPVKRIPHDRAHPRETRQRHVSGLPEREARLQPVEKNVEVDGEMQVGLVHVAAGGGCALREQRPRPTLIRVADTGRAERVDVDRHRARLKTKIRPRERSGYARTVPAEIKRDFAHRKAGLKQLGAPIDHDRQIAFLRGLFQPRLPFVERARIGAKPARINVAAAPQAGLLHGERVLDHPPDDCVARPIEAPDQHHRGKTRFQNPAVAAKIRVRHEARNRAREDAERRQLRIDGRAVRGLDRRRLPGRFISRVGRCQLLDFERNAAHQHQIANAV